MAVDNTIRPSWPDPQIKVGEYRILPRTDNRWIAYDERMPPAKASAVIADTQELCIERTRALVALGSPMQTAAEPPVVRERPPAKKKGPRR